MKKRKHRLVVEMTTSSPLTEREARQGLQLLLDRNDLQARPIWAYYASPYAEKLEVKEFSRVARTLK